VTLLITYRDTILGEHRIKKMN